MIFYDPCLLLNQSLSEGATSGLAEKFSWTLVLNIFFRKNRIKGIEQ
jgi:hypothetical protein